MSKLRVAAGAVAGAVALTGAVIALDWVWQTGASSQLVARTFGDPTISIEAPLPPAPRYVLTYRTGEALATTDVSQVLPGRVRIQDGWLFWHGSSQLSAAQAMQRINPGVAWRADDNRLGPAPPGPAHGVATRGLSGAFTGTAVWSNSFGVYAQRQGRLVFLSIPAHRITTGPRVRVIPPGKALLRLIHHSPGTTVTPATVPLLPWRLTGDPIIRPAPIEEVKLVQSRDPGDPAGSRPMWVFGDAGEVPAVP